MSLPDQPVILQIIPELGTGGAEQGCIDVAAELVRAGSKALVISHKGSRVHELSRIKAIHINLPVHSKNPLTILRNAKKIRKTIEEYKVDIVHARSRAPAWSAYLACKKTNAKFMTTAHAPYNFHNKIKRFYNAIMTKGERVIAISHYVGQYLVNNYKINPSLIRLIHRGVNLEKFHPSQVTPAQMIKISESWRLPEGANIILLPGRLTRWKGHHVLIEAMEKINHQDVFCVLLGPDQGRKEYREELENMIKEKNLSGRVRIADNCTDMPAAYMVSTIVVSASTDPEGFGRIPIEAQAMGRPVIGTDHGGAQETIIHNETGWLVPPGDANAMAEAIEEALRLNDQQRQVLGGRAMTHIAHHFTKEKMVDETLNVYAELLQEKYNIVGTQDTQTAKTAA